MKYRAALLFGIGLSLLAVSPLSAAEVVYRNDFQGAVGVEWSNTATATTPQGNRRFLGQFHNNAVQLTLSDLPRHSQVTVSFDLFIIGSWDGNNLAAGPDQWSLAIVETQPLINTTFSNGAANQAFPEPYPGGDAPARTDAVESNTLGFLDEQQQPADAVYRISVTFPHSRRNLALQFAGLGLAGETWGLDNVEVVTEDFPPGKISVAPRKLNFGRTRVGESETRRIRLRNSSKGPLRGNVGFVNAPFEVISGSGSFVLPGKSSLVIEVRFTPTAAGPFNDALIINSDARKKNRITVKVSGRGRNP